MELFQPNDLSRLKPEFVPLDNNRCYEDIVLLLRTQYNFLNLSTVQIERFVAINSLSENFRLTLNDGKYFLKCRVGDEAKQALLQEAEMAVKLTEKGLRVPQVIKTATAAYVSFLNHKCCILYVFQEGHYFSGKGRELKSAAESFGQLTKAVAEVTQRMSETLLLTRLPDDLESLLEEATTNKDCDPALTNLCSTHLKVILNNLQDVGAKRSIVESHSMLVHLDYHPQNILMKNGEVACILDFEDLKVYPVLAGLGFGGYKLIRQMMVTPEIRVREMQNPSLVGVWLDGWRKSFPQLPFSAAELGLGARYRLLSLIRTILYTYLRLSDDKFNWALAKHIGSLYEIDVIFSGRHSTP